MSDLALHFAYASKMGRPQQVRTNEVSYYCEDNMRIHVIWNQGCTNEREVTSKHHVKSILVVMCHDNP